MRGKAPKLFVLLTALGLISGPAVSGSVAAGENPYESRAEFKAEGEIDKLVFVKLERLNVQPARICSDAVFVRRACLDVIGTLPTPKEASDFLLSREPNKRAALIDRLLEREEFADYWAMKWSDRLRVKAEFPINLWPNAAQAYHRWIRTAIRENMPYDQFARAMLTANGSNFREPTVNFYRALQNKSPTGIAQTVALTFMGTQADKWPTNQLAGMAVFFSQVTYKYSSEWKEEIVFFDPAKTNAATAMLPDGTQVQLSPTDKDPREIFADWLIDPKNPWFTRNIVNRVWFWLQGRGIVQEPDDLRPDNPPSNPELLAFLAAELVSSRYDLKHLYRLILNSRTYQLSSIPGTDDPQGATSFAAYPLRRLDAKVLIDALCQITGSTEKYTSAIPEPFTFIPETQRSIALPDGSISSPFLEMFGRPARDTGLESERNNRPTAGQSLHLLNSSHVQRKIQQSRMVQNLTQSRTSPCELISGLYLATLSRFPTEEELKIVSAHLDSAKVNRREAAVDVVWALVNGAEFLYRH